MNKRDAKVWRPIDWKDVKVGQEVWLAGTESGKFKAYGPHRVADPERRILESGTLEVRGVEFQHYPEELIVPRG